MTDPLAAVPSPQPSVPVFGRRAERAPAPRKPFALEVQYRDRGRTVTEEVSFTTYTNLDAGAMLRLMQAGDDPMAVANATAFVLATSLVDDDGVSAEWATPDPELDYALDDEAEEDVPLRGEPADGQEKGPLLYERWDGELVPWEELTFDEWEDGSSRRRFAHIMSSTRYRVELDALKDVSRWLMEQGGGRPTGRPAPSGRGPQSTRRGSAGRRR